jgi:hypothetical protein
MEKSKIDLFLLMNADNFHPQDLLSIKDRLESIPDDKAFIVQTISLQKPDFILIIAIVLGWERFWLNDVVLGVIKVITCYGCGLWWLIDIFTAKSRARTYNFKKFIQVTSFI